MLEGIPLAFGSITATAILDHRHVPPPGRKIASLYLIRLIVRRAFEKHREFSWSVRPVNISAQSNTVPHPNRHIVFNHYRIRLRCPTGNSSKHPYHHAQRHASFHRSPQWSGVSRLRKSPPATCLF